MLILEGSGKSFVAFDGYSTDGTTVWDKTGM